MKKVILTFIFVFMSVFSIQSQQKPNRFITVKNGEFIKEGKPYAFIGTNFWYGAILGSTGEGGNRERLLKELDFMKSIGIDNLRILVGSDGLGGVVSKVEPTLQTAPGVYNDAIFDGLDFLLSEMKKRNMHAVLYLNNSWEWSGGYSQYLQWAGYGKAPIPAVDGWDAYMKYVAWFFRSEVAMHIFSKYVKDVVTRTNRYTKVKYVDDPTIMSWQIGNEPRAFSDQNKARFAQWIGEVAKLIKSLDANHLVSTGSEGSQGCEQDMNLFERIHSYPEVDYMNIHIWPYNWGWAKPDQLEQSIPLSISNAKKYIEEHLVVAEKYAKPIVLEEFGFPRNGLQFNKELETTARDAFYASIFEMVADKEKYGLLAGCNFWAWGGFAELSESHTFWQKGDDYTGDPAQEEQGLNSVFTTDTTIEVIRQATQQLNK